MSKVQDFIDGLDSYLNGEGESIKVMNDSQIRRLIKKVKEECNQWIPVGERFPEKSGHNQYSRAVTVYCERNKCQYAGCYDHEMECWVLFGELYTEISGVTHWQPQNPPPAK